MMETNKKSNNWLNSWLTRILAIASVGLMIKIIPLIFNKGDRLTKANIELLNKMEYELGNKPANVVELNNSINQQFKRADSIGTSEALIESIKNVLPYSRARLLYLDTTIAIMNSYEDRIIGDSDDVHISHLRATRDNCLLQRMQGYELDSIEKYLHDTASRLYFEQHWAIMLQIDSGLSATSQIMKQLAKEMSSK